MIKVAKCSHCGDQYQYSLRLGINIQCKFCPKLVCQMSTCPSCIHRLRIKHVLECHASVELVE